MGKKVGFNRRVSINVMEMAMNAAIEGTYTPELAAELAMGMHQGENSVGKAKVSIGRLTAKNPLLEYVKEHKQEYYAAIKHKGDRALVFAALINATYEFGYDIVAILGKYFHVQEEIVTSLIVNKLSLIYTSNRYMLTALYYAMPMYIEAGLIDRPEAGIYKKKELEIVTTFARDLYIKSFLINNPMFEWDESHLEHPYFEFV
jgi:hypothetical protein